jgi:hypothetical protein
VGGKQTPSIPGPGRDRSSNERKALLLNSPLVFIAVFVGAGVGRRARRVLAVAEGRRRLGAVKRDRHNPGEERVTEVRFKLDLSNFGSQRGSINCRVHGPAELEIWDADRRAPGFVPVLELVYRCVFVRRLFPDTEDTICGRTFIKSFGQQNAIDRQQYVNKLLRRLLLPHCCHF